MTPTLVVIHGHSADQIIVLPPEVIAHAQEILAAEFALPLWDFDLTKKLTAKS